MGAPVEQLLAERARLALPGADVDWVNALRAENARQFCALGLPSLRDEDWKYTSIKPIAKRSFVPADGDGGLTNEALHSFAIPGLDSHRVVLANGCHMPGLSRLEQVPEGVRIAGLAATIDSEPALLQGWLGRLSAEPEHGFRALNTAYLQDGVCIFVPDGCRLDKPIELVHVQCGPADDIVCQPRHLVVAGTQAKFTLIERYISLHDRPCLTNSITEVFAQAGAELEHYKLQQESIRGYHIASWLIEQRERSRVVTHNIALGGAIARTDIRVRLAGPQARSELNGVYVLGDRQHVDNHTKVAHEVPDTVSREYYKGVLDGRSRAVFHGRVVVQPDAQRTDASQQNKNLLLSRHAEVDTKPQLEIYADDVACSHGATVGQLDDEAVFYLRSRGVDEQTARGLLTFAFANDLIARFELPALCAYLERQLANKMFSVDELEAVL